ncbi:UDP-N-acetylglucosamine 2-epimerase (non-hydrolyzing) (plasmid) [Agrobacterium sp. MA01]|uniref:non-hydrolyzing UDP-N-acetylglucosamine 2-epimerase n=1 Tax=Agrobacterium sp. MA01 TaxID=2664893 RepID=UPI00129B108C|nr:UDP-N-acetylglucosamine 2-epimerase (non-hydrolyzing) [Agrobacterium sp. MA01]QGG93515.1 UDP-N-acetylglucosamine 2-epimerase (non-hydrolyzing) [Agrobacterium sp. MA01]
MKKIVTILGARPQFVKAGVVSQALVRSGEFTEVLVHTGQHFHPNMSDVFFSELGLSQPAYNLGIHGGGHGSMTGKMLAALEEVLIRERPDIVLVYGDTNSTLAGALAAAKLHIPVAHVEAGLRSFNMAMPEEVNRILTDRVSTWLFAPGEAAAENLRREGMPEASIHVVGDVMYDVALQFSEKIDASGRQLARLGLQQGSYVLATIHRAENTDDEKRLLTIASAFEMMAAQRPVVWPLHPRTRAVLSRLGRLDEISRRLHVLEPIGYLDMIQLEKYASLIATDSGGVQKEAYFYGVPCVTLRNETEWSELISSGWNRLVLANDPAMIVEEMGKAMQSRGNALSLFGDGKAADIIVDRIRVKGGG